MADVCTSVGVRGAEDVVCDGVWKQDGWKSESCEETEAGCGRGGGGEVDVKRQTDT